MLILVGYTDEDAALVQHLQYAIPSARLSSTDRRSPDHVFGRVIDHDNLFSFQLMYHFACNCFCRILSSKVMQNKMSVACLSCMLRVNIAIITI